MNDIIKRVNELGYDVYFLEIDSCGFMLPDLQTIIISQNLDEESQIQILLHEFKHALSHTDYIYLYSSSPMIHCQMEREADEYMVKNYIKMKGGVGSISGVMEDLNLGLGWEEKIKSWMIAEDYN